MQPQLISSMILLELAGIRSREFSLPYFLDKTPPLNKRRTIDGEIDPPPQNHSTRFEAVDWISPSCVPSTSTYRDPTMPLIMMSHTFLKGFIRWYAPSLEFDGKLGRAWVTAFILLNEREINAVASYQGNITRATSCRGTTKLYDS